MIDAQRNLLAYSTYRRDLVALVWESEALLLVEPEMYTEGARVALQDQIDRAKAALNGSADVPFVRVREFLKPRADEPIQFASQYFSRVPSYTVGTWGLKPALAWYRQQHLLADTYQTTDLSPSDDTFVHLSTPTTTRGSAVSLIIGGGRTTYFKWNLAPISARIQSAAVFVTNNSSNNNTYYLNYESNDTWAEASRTYNNTLVGGQLVIGPRLGEAQSGARNSTSSVDVSGQAVAEQSGDKTLSLSMTQNPASTYPLEIHSKEASTASYRPFLRVTFATVDAAKLEAKYTKVVGLAQTLLGEASVGAAVGQYPQSAVAAVDAALSAAASARSSGDQYQIGVALAEVYNTMRAMRYAQVLRSSAEPDSSLYLPEGGVEELRARINTYPELKAEFDKLKAMSDTDSLADIQSLDLLLAANPDYDLLNSRFKMWSVIPSQNFTTPASAATAQLAVTLPATENEASGLGHAWIDDITIENATTGAALNILNPGFEQGSATPDSWQPVATAGAPVLQVESRTNYANSGTRSIFLQNPTASDQATWRYTRGIPVTAGASHVLQYYAKIDGKFKSGLQVTLTFKDANGATVGSFTSTANRKSSFGPANFNLTMQIDALVYAVTGDRSYAEKAKARMFWFLNDQLQGIEYWLVNNARPDNIDAYGAVQNGRNAASATATYTLIRDAGVFSAAEKADLMRKIDYLLTPLSDLRDRTEMTAYAAQLNTGNWETDMSAGASLIGMTFPELPNARQWIDNGRIVLEGQLQYTLRDDGGWPESIRYHSSAMGRFSAYAKALRNQTGEDWFTGDSKLKKMFEFILQTQTPPYAYMGNHISTPDFGDHILSDGSEFALLGIYFDEIARTNPALGAQVYQTWQRAGKPFTNYWGEAVTLENFFSPIAYDTSGLPPLNLQSSGDTLRPWGMTIFRDQFNTANEAYLALIANETAIGHSHYDQGSFIIYSRNVPLVMDPGIESYFDATKGWYVSSAAHSTLQFRNAGVYRDTPLSSRWEDSVFTSPSLDMARVSIANPSVANARQYRSVAYVKDGIGAFVVWDQIKGATDTTRFNLPVAAASTSVQGNTAISLGHFGVDLETTFLQPANATIQQQWAQVYPSFVPKINGLAQLNYLRVEAPAGQNFLTVLYPRAQGSAGLATEQLAVNASGVEAYRLQTADGKWVIVVASNSENAQQVVLPIDETLINMQSGARTEASTGGVAVDVAGSRITIFKPKASQTISFAELPDRSLGDPAFTVSASASSGLPIGFAASGSCTITSDGTVTLTNVGTCTITASQAGNEAYKPASVSRSFAILYRFAGFFAPLSNPGNGSTPVFNQVNAGRGIPVRFSLGGDWGLQVVAAGYPKVEQVSCASGGTMDEVEETVTAGSSGLSYDATSGQYTYTWKTDKAWASSCRKFTMRLADGTDHIAYFSFTK